MTIEYTNEKRKEARLPRVKIINFTGKAEVTCNYQKISLPLKAGEADPKTLSAKQGAKF
jgi:hypothetical protein